jgi:ABC-type bacteriocin/lantibiotic exporter with double-glycine peptidase domain
VATTARSVLILITCLALAHLIVTRIWSEPETASGCGPRALYAVSRQLGLSASCETIAALFAGHGRSANFADIAAAAKRLGLRAEGGQLTVPQLRAERPLGVLHVDDIHFVAVVGYEAGGVWVADPLYAGEPRRVWWLEGDLAARWDGRMLIVRKG